MTRHLAIVIVAHKMGSATLAAPARSAVFDDPCLVSTAGLVPVVALAEHAGLRELAAEHSRSESPRGSVLTAAAAVRR